MNELQQTIHNGHRHVQEGPKYVDLINLRPIEAYLTCRLDLISLHALDIPIIHGLPPAARILAPLQYELPSLSNHQMTSAISSGRPALCIGMFGMALSSMS